MPSVLLNSSRFASRFIGGLALAGLIVTAGCGKSEAPAANSAAPAPIAPKDVRVTNVRLRTWPKTIRVQGKLLSFEQSTISTKMAGRIESLLVDRGKQVKKGDTLAVFEKEDLELKVQQAAAQLAQACATIGLTPEQSELELKREMAPPVVVEQALLKYAEAAVERAETLKERGGVTKDEYENLVAQRNVADAKYKSALNSVGAMIASVGVRRTELALAREHLAEATIVAPFDAVVEQRHVGQGESVLVSAPIVTLVRVDTLRFTAGVPERAAAPLREGQVVQIHCEGNPQVLQAAISRVSPSVDPDSRVVWFEADVRNVGQLVRAGQFAEAEIIIDPDEKTLSVPATAVRDFAGLEKVFVVRDGKAAEQTIRTGRRTDHWVEVLGGLEAGDTIVTTSNEHLAGPVRPLPDSTPETLAETALPPEEGGASQ